MPRFNVEADGLWACYSTIVDGFVTPFWPKADYEQWRQDQYGKNCGLAEDANRMTLTEALWKMSVCNSDEEICRNLREAGIFYAEEDDER